MCGGDQGSKCTGTPVLWAMPDQASFLNFSCTFPYSCSAQVVIVCFEHTIQMWPSSEIKWKYFLHQLLQQQQQYRVTMSLLSLLSPNWAATKQRQITSTTLPYICRLWESLSSGKLWKSCKCGAWIAASLCTATPPQQEQSESVCHASHAAWTLTADLVYHMCIEQIADGLRAQPCNLTVCCIATLQVHLSQK